MNVKHILITCIGILVAGGLLFQSCKKDEPAPPTYTNGEGKIGTAGGTIIVDDPTSPINGAKLVVPKDALNQEVMLKIAASSTNYNIPGFQNPIIIECTPKGQQFLKPVSLYLPYQNTASAAYYYDAQYGTLEQLEVLGNNTGSKLLQTQSSHFSLFFAESEALSMDIELVKSNGHFAAYGFLGENLNNIPTHELITQYENAYQVAENEEYNSLVSYQYILYKKTSSGLPEVVARKNYYVYLQTAYKQLAVDKGYNTVNFDAQGHVQFYAKRVNDIDVRTNTWMRGLPLLMIFDDDSFIDPNFSNSGNDAFFVKCTWTQNKPWNPTLANRKWTMGYTFSTAKEAAKWDNLVVFTEDRNDNGIIDSYESGMYNDPPYKPDLIAPIYDETDVSPNSAELQWECEDPDGDELVYDVYFGESYPPSTLIAEEVDFNSLIISNLDENTRYYWRVDAMDNEEIVSGSTWKFVTGYDDNTPPPIANFVITPGGGTTSTNLVFDATSCTDNTFDTGELEVRWDFDGDGNWDTDWDTGKTENYQYSTEGTFIPKMEVRNPAHLTHSRTIDIVISNGSGSGVFVDPRDGEIYNLTTIGSQTWFARNLNYDSENSWWFGNDESYGELYGKFYRWSALAEACPDGWHVPSDNEWKILEKHLGMSSLDANERNWRGDADEGKKLKSTSGWDDYYGESGNGTNTSGFTARPAGASESGIYFLDMGKKAWFWTSTEYGTVGAILRLLNYTGSSIYRYDGNKNIDCISVRCIKD